MNKSLDDLDLKLIDWAAKTPPLLKLANVSDLDTAEALAALQAAGQAIVAVKPPRTSEVGTALNALRFEQRQLVQLHFLLPEISVRLKSKFADFSEPAYLRALGVAKEFLRGHLAAAATDARIPLPFRRSEGTITSSR